MGVASDMLTDGGSHRSVIKGGMGTELSETRMPTLNILDSIWVNAEPGEGPRTGYQQATQLNLIMASLDPIALDYWAAKHVLMQVASLRGHGDLARIDPENIEATSFGGWLRLSMEELRRRGHQVTMNEDQMNVYTVSL
jgi:hypothetical protein